MTLPRFRDPLATRRAFGVCAAFMVLAAACSTSSSDSSGSGGDGGESAGGGGPGGGGPGGGQGSGGAPPMLDLTAALEQATADNEGLGGAVCRVHAPAWGDLWEGASGDAWQGGPAMAPEDTFEVASVTKTFTAVAVLQDVEEGLLSLDDAIGDHLDASWTTGLLVVDGHDYGPEITVRQLLSHTSGLPDYWTDPPYTDGPETNAFLGAFESDEDHEWTPEEIISYVPGLDPVDLPGGAWHYSDTNYVLLGVMLESLHGEPYDQVLRSRILVPLGMTDTYLSYHEAPAAAAAESHRYEGTLDLYGQKRQSADWAGGGLVSSTADLLVFIEALAQGAVFADPGTLATMQSWTPTGTDGVEYGLGLFRVDLGDGMGELWGHDGYGNAWMYHWPERGVSFVGTLNQTENDWWPLVSEAIDQLGAP